MIPVSVVILTKNEEKHISNCIKPWIGITDDILIVDNGSTDNTVSIAKELGATIHTTTWKGYSHTKNEGNTQTKYDWILSLDTDEYANTQLVQSVQDVFQITPHQNNIYAIKRKMVYNGKALNYGSVSNEYRVRLFNKKNAQWNNNDVHEDIETKNTSHQNKLLGYVLHNSFINKKDYTEKQNKYANLKANQLYKEGKHATFLKQYISPLFGFIKNYFFRLGFLDGIQGLQYAIQEMNYTFRKYRILNELNAKR